MQHVARRQEAASVPHSVPAPARAPAVLDFCILRKAAGLRLVPPVHLPTDPTLQDEAEASALVVAPPHHSAAG